MIMKDDRLILNYLCDLGDLIKEKALEAKRNKDGSTGQADYDYELGRLMGYHEVVSLMQQQAQTFGISLDKIHLSDIDPEKDLL